MQETQKDPDKVAAAYKGLLGKYMTSQKWTLTKADLQKWGKNAAIFFSAGVVLFLLDIQRGATVQQAATVFYYWLLATIIDLIRKWAAENTYTVK